VLKQPMPGGPNLVGSTIFCRVATVIQYAALMSMVGLHLGFWQTCSSCRSGPCPDHPHPGIAGIGTGQAWWAGALLLEGVNGSLAVAAGLTLQAIDLAVSLPVAGIGSTLLFRRKPGPLSRGAADDDVSDEEAGARRGGTPTPPSREPLHVA